MVCRLSSSPDCEIVAMNADSWRDISRDRTAQLRPLWSCTAAGRSQRVDLNANFPYGGRGQWLCQLALALTRRPFSPFSHLDLLINRSSSLLYPSHPRRPSTRHESLRHRSFYPSLSQARIQPYALLIVW